MGGKQQRKRYETDPWDDSSICKHSSSSHGNIQGVIRSLPGGNLLTLYGYHASSSVNFSTPPPASLITFKSVNSPH